jgi:hypothetical protein
MQSRTIQFVTALTLSITAMRSRAKKLPYSQAYYEMEKRFRAE